MLSMYSKSILLPTLGEGDREAVEGEAASTPAGGVFPHPRLRRDFPQRGKRDGLLT